MNETEIETPTVCEIYRRYATVSASESLGPSERTAPVEGAMPVVVTSRPRAIATQLDLFHPNIYVGLGRQHRRGLNLSQDALLVPRGL